MISKLIINIKKLILVLLSASFISFILPSNLLNNTVFAEIDHYSVSSFEDMKNAIKKIQNGEAILLYKDVTIPENDNYLVIDKNITITSTPKRNYKIVANPKSKFLDIRSNFTVTLDNVTVNLFRSHDVDQYSNNQIKIDYDAHLRLGKGATIHIGPIANKNSKAVYKFPTECWYYPELKVDHPVGSNSNGNLTAPRLKDMKDDCTGACIKNKEKNDKTLTEGMDYTHGQDLIPITSPPNKKLNPKSKFLDTYNNCAINLKNIPVNLSGNDDVNPYNNKHIKMHYGSQLWIDKGDIINTECWDYPELKVDCPVVFTFNGNLTAPRLKNMKDDCTGACIKNKEKNDKTLTDGSGSDQVIYESNNTKVSTIDNDGIDISLNNLFLDGTSISNYNLTLPKNNIISNDIAESDDIQLNIPSDSKDNKLTFINPLDLIKNNKLKTTDPTNNLQQDMNYDSNNSDDSTNPDIDEPIIYDDPDEIFEAEDSNTGIQVYAPKGVFPKLSGLIVREMYPNTDEYDNMYKNLDENIKRKIEHIRLYEVCVVNQNGEVIQPNISKGLVTVRIPIPNDYDLADLQIYRIKHDANDNFETNVININNKNYCKFQTNHFSTYTMIDEKTTNDIILSILPYLILLSILTLMSLFIFILKKE